MSFLLDTDICSASMKGLPLVSNRFIQYSGRLHISSVTLAELFAWALRAKASPKRLQSLLDLRSRCSQVRRGEGVATGPRPFFSRLGFAERFGGLAPQSDNGNAQHPGLCQHPRVDP
jgi:hypothetical protein